MPTSKAFVHSFVVKAKYFQQKFYLHWGLNLGSLDCGSSCVYTLMPSQLCNNNSLITNYSGHFFMAQLLSFESN